MTPGVCERCGATTQSFDSRPRRFCSRVCWRERAKPSLADRFWPKVRRSGPIPAHAPELGECWIWTGSEAQHGYGQFSVNRRPAKAHRVAWFLTHGRWPKPCALHKCDNGGIGCVRPDHLYEGTPADNSRDMVERGRVVTPGLRGSDHPRSKLTEDLVREMRARHAAGESQRALARAFGVDMRNVTFVVRRKTWAHVA